LGEREEGRPGGGKVVGRLSVLPAMEASRLGQGRAAMAVAHRCGRRERKKAVAANVP